MPQALGGKYYWTLETQALIARNLLLPCTYGGGFLQPVWLSNEFQCQLGGDALLLKQDWEPLLPLALPWLGLFSEACAPLSLLLLEKSPISNSC